MKNVTYINAGAGSGKTYTLTERLADLIEREHIRPEQVILTTFTTKAAAEFKEKAKGFLFERGLYDEAIRLDQALVGTVHSVANALINKFWFKLGLPPSMGVIAEEDVEFYISQSLSSLPEDAELKQLHAFVREFDIQHGYGSEKRGLNYDLWKEHLKRIIDYSTNYEITDFTRSREQSLAFIRQFVTPGVGVSHTAEELQALLREHQATLDGYKKSDANDVRKDTLRELGYGMRQANVGWYKKLAGLLAKTEKKNGTLGSAVLRELGGLWHSDLVYKKQEEYITLLFELAGRWQRQFAEYKKEKRVLDYNDMEKYLLRLTEIPSAREELALSFRYLFVDEFQDCSPIQVKIFDRLSELMEHSYWVGDYKQSIYGFRGSDVALVKAVVDNVSQREDCTTETLKTSWRSLPDIVDVCNESFKRTFAGVLPQENIVLRKHRENKDGIASLRYIMVNEEKDCTGALADQIAWLIHNEHVQPKDIAVICRANAPLDELAGYLQDDLYNIPVSRNNQAVTESNAALLVQALLQLVVSDSNTLAKATVAWLTVKDFTTSRLVDSKLDWDSQEGNKPWEYLNDTPLVARLLAQRPSLRQQGVAALVETLIIELGLYDVVKQWPFPSWSASCLDVLINVAAAYEQHSLQMGLPATVSGYLDYVGQMKPTAAGDSNGVQLHTYHSCKGLQWKYVFLMSLNEHPANEMKIAKDGFYGVNVCHACQPTAEHPYPETFIRLVPFVYGTGSNIPADIFMQIQNDPNGEYGLIYSHAIEEANRLLYVGMTRAADVLTLAIEKPKRGLTPLQWPEDIGLTPDASAIGHKKADLLGVGIGFTNTTAIEEELCTIKAFTDEEEAYNHMRIAKDANATKEYLPRDISPSNLSGTMDVKEHAVIGERIPVNSPTDLDYAEVGNCVHQIFCGIDRQTDKLAFARQVTAAYGLTDVLPQPEAIVGAWDNLKARLTADYGSPVAIYHERPFQQERDGHIITGSMDLVWQTEEGCVVVDFKTNPMSIRQLLDEQSDHFVGLYGGQLSSYAHALEAAELTVTATLIYYPVSALLVSLTDDRNRGWDTSYDLQASITGRKPNTYLLRWNPAISSFTLDNYIKAVDDYDGEFDMNWSIYEYENAYEGDRYYMIRVGEGETGIVWRGVFTSDPYKSHDWAGTSRQRYYVDIECMDATHPDRRPHITIPQLQAAIPGIDWNRGHSGVLLTDEQARKLDELWNNKAGK